jgi:protease secretion system outer membrane protein
MIVVLLLTWSIPSVQAQQPEDLADTVSQPAAAASESQAKTLDLVQVHALMLRNDPQVLGARAARDAGRDSKNIARAALLPQATLSYLRNRTNKREVYETTGSGSQTDTDTFYGLRAGLTIEQTLFDYSAITTYRMGKLQSEHADVQYRLQLQQQAVTLIDAYLNAILARESLALARHQVRIYQDMLRDNKSRLAKGEGTRIDILETRAQLGTTQVELMNYDNALADRLRELSALLGEPVQADELMGIDLQSMLPPMKDGSLAALLEDAQQQNSEMQAARLSVRYNDLTVEQEKGQFMPRVSVYASHEHVVSDTINNEGRDYKTRVVGLQVSLPLFNGGSSYYSTRQANNRLEQARYELERTYNTTVTTLEQYYRVFASSAKRVRTLRENVSDSAALVEAIHKSVAGGERTNTDALQAERQSYLAHQELLRTYVEWFQSYIKLQFYSGRFSEDDILALNENFVTDTGFRETW